MTSAQLKQLARTGQAPEVTGSKARAGARAAVPARSAVLLLAFSNCAASSAGGSLLFSLSATDRDTEVDWTVHAGNVTRTGTVQVSADPDSDDELGDVQVAGLPLGPVTLEIREHDNPIVIDGAELSVLRCVRAAATACQASFSNPAGNPNVTVFDEGSVSLFGPSAEFDLAAGAERRLVSEPGASDWLAIRTSDIEPLSGGGDDEGEDDVRIVASLAGQGPLSVRPCSSRFLTTNVSCVAAGQRSQLAVDLPGDTLRQRDLVLHVSPFIPGPTVVTVKGRGAGSARTYSFETNRLKTGAYRVLLETADGTQVISSRSFAVVECVKVTTGCRSVQFANPDGNPVVTIAYSGGRVRVGPGKVATVRSDRRRISWTGTAMLPKDASPTIVSALGEPPRKAFATAGKDVDLRRTCAVAATNASGPLADTGSSTLINILGPAGFGATVLGLALLLAGRSLRRRRSAARPRRG